MECKATRAAATNYGLTSMSKKCGLIHQNAERLEFAVCWAHYGAGRTLIAPRDGLTDRRRGALETIRVSAPFIDR
jgi:hypothetical protein